MNDFETMIISDHLKEILDHAGREDSDKLWQLLFFARSWYQQLVSKIPLPALRAVVFREKIEETLGKELAENHYAKKITCKKGCSHCCKIPVSATSDEAEILKQHLSDHPVTNGGCRFSLPRSPFLKGSLCSIYDIRPVACRKYFSRDKPFKCDLNTHHELIEKFVPIQTEILWSGAVSVVGAKNLNEL